MAKISNKKIYEDDIEIRGDEYIIGTDTQNSKKTKNYPVSVLKDYIIDGISNVGVDANDPEDDSFTDGILNSDGTYTWLKYSIYPDGLNNGTATMIDEPIVADILYIGLAFNKDTRVESDDPTDYIWSDNGGAILMPDGTYTYVKYADTIDPTTGLSDEPLGKTWFGISTGNTSATESTNWVDYEWSKIIGNDGEDGVGIAGTTKFAWFKYSEFATGYDLNSLPSITDVPTPITKYIGITYNKDTFVESDVPSDYKWSLLSGDILQANGLYTWLKYAVDPINGPMDDFPEGQLYIGFAFDKATPESTTPEANLLTSYQWSPLYGSSNGDTFTGQDNQIKHILINTNDLLGGIVNADTIATYINQNGIVVDEVENVVFEFYTGGVTPPPPPPIEVLDPSLTLDLTVGAPTINSVLLSWNDNGDIALNNYKITYKNLNTNTTFYKTLNNVNTYMLTGLPSGTPFSVFVTGYDSSNNSKDSLIELFDTEAVVVNTYTPIFTNLYPPKTSTTVDLKWYIDPAFGADTYVVSVNGVPLPAVTSTTYTVTGLTPATVYTFSVTAYTAAAVASDPSLDLVVTTDVAVAPPLTTPILEVPLSSITIDSASGIVTLPASASAEWDRIVGVNFQYRVKGSTLPFFNFYLNKTEFNVYPFPTLLPSTTFEAQVATYDGVTTSAYSNLVEFFTLSDVLVNNIKMSLSTRAGLSEGYLNIIRGIPNTDITIQMLVVVLDSNGLLVNKAIGGSINFDILNETILEAKPRNIIIRLDNRGGLSFTDGHFNIADIPIGYTYQITATIVNAVGGIPLIDTATAYYVSEIPV